MKMELWVVGRTTTPYIQSGIDIFSKRIVHYVPFDINVFQDIKTTKSLSEDKQKLMEGQRMLDALQPGDWVVLLDEKGKEYTSREFASYVDKRMVSVARRMIFVVGGPYGFSKAMYDRADEKMSLSKMTFPHEMVRLFFVEQLYRAMTILCGEPYHHD